MPKNGRSWSGTARPGNRNVRSVSGHATHVWMASDLSQLWPGRNVNIRLVPGLTTPDLRADLGQV